MYAFLVTEGRALSSYALARPPGVCVFATIEGQVCMHFLVTEGRALSSYALARPPGVLVYVFVSS